jgi:hypothetical protein
VGDATPIGAAADRVLSRLKMISGLRCVVDACPTHNKRRALIAAAHASGAIDDQELISLLAEAA